MREIKFRAWDKDRNCWAKNSFDLVWALESGKHRGYWNNCIFMQNTGLKDKDNNEIYEGDIIIMMPSYKYVESIYVVEWSETLSTYFLKSLVKKIDVCSGDTISYYKSKDNGYEIIGNIYENPELLKEDK